MLLVLCAAEPWLPHTKFLGHLFLTVVFLAELVTVEGAGTPLRFR